MLLRGFRRYPEEKDSWTNVEANFCFLRILFTEGCLDIHACIPSFIHLTSFNLVPPVFQAVLRIGGAKMNTIYFLFLGILL